MEAYEEPNITLSPIAVLESNTSQEMPTLTSPSLGVNFICKHLTHTRSIFSKRKLFGYRVGDEVADYLLDPINVDVDNKLSLRFKGCVVYPNKAALLICTCTV